MDSWQSFLAAFCLQVARKELHESESKLSELKALASEQRKALQAAEGWRQRDVVRLKQQRQRVREEQEGHAHANLMGFRP